MKATAAICFLLVFFYSSFTRGDQGKNTASPNPKLSETSSAPQLNSSEVEHSAAEDPSTNGTLTQGGNETASSTFTDRTEAPDSTTTTAGTTVDLVTAVNGTNVSGNLTNSQEGSDLSAADNNTLSTMTAPIYSTLPSTQLPTTKTATNPETSTAAPTTQPQTPPAVTMSQRTTVSHKSTTTSPPAKTTQSQQKTSTATTTVVITTTTLQPVEVTKAHSSTPVQAKARADTPSELNVGDDDSKAYMDPLLVGLVSVFVVTAIIISLLIFLKFRRRNERPEFRRLQDLPMDDMMEDTPLSMYSY